MFCRHCGNELPDGTTFCLKCGKDDSLENTAERDQGTDKGISFEYVPTNQAEDIYDSKRDKMASSILTFAIMGLAFGVSHYLSVLGLIFSVFSRSKLNKYLKQYSDTVGKATVGKHLGLAGLIISIVSTAYWILNITSFLLETFTPITINTLVF